MKVLNYKEYGRTEIAALRFVFGTLFTMPGIVSSHFDMRHVIPDEYDRSSSAKDSPEYRYYLVHLHTDSSQAKKNVFLRLEIPCDNRSNIHTEVVGYYFCTNKEMSEFDLINGQYISVK